jgi:RNA polymerase-binding transcription factor DksA
MEKHSCQIDAASSLEEDARSIVIGRIRAVAARIDTSNTYGTCWQCNAYIGDERRFCNKECAAQWSKENES